MIRSRKKRKKVAFENRLIKHTINSTTSYAASLFNMFGFYPDKRNKNNKIEAQYHYDMNTKLK